MVAEAQKPLKRRLGQRGMEIPVYTRAKARNMYLQQCLPYAAISEATGLSVTSLMQLACREGWTELKRQQKKRLLQKADERGEAMQNEVAESIASRSEQYALRTLDRVGGSLERDDPLAARDAQSYTGALKNLVSVVRDIRAPQQQQQQGSTLNMFILRVGDAVKPAAAPAVDVAATALK